MSPLEKVPFATFYPLQKYLRGTCFFKNDFFKWTHILMFKGDSMYSILSIDATFFSTFLKGIIRKECQSFTNHGHDKTPPTVFNPLSLWLTLPRDMGVSHTLWPPSITRAILACLWFAQGLYRVCTGFAQGLYRVPKNQNSRAIHPAARFICNAYMLYVYGAHVTNRSKSFILDLGH